ncbi:unnamed protein product [Danaus chrysippus]|uniref:(African queen) hypothetical protein n=1 Tax=Danaus chrysippus TaxID=151541 RepID=A0A8J2R940_9NEOP|nr:unnamed protein product [Danaus chrysippus]
MAKSIQKNGDSQNILAKAPWTDEQGIGMKIYEGVVLTLEVIILIIKMYATWFYRIYKFFVPNEPKSLKGEIVLITGAGHGMGREMALSFAKLGSIVVCVDINPTGNEETVNMVRENKGQAHRYLCDVTNRSAINEMADRIRKEVGEVSILVNNAGIMPCKPLLKQTEKEIRATFEVNCLAHIWRCPSMAGVLGLRNLVPYCGTKFAVRGMMEAVYEELREDPRDFSGSYISDLAFQIKLTCICPYIVDTGLCKNPKIKFPTLMKIISPQEAVANIIDAVRRDYHEITIPSSLYYTNQFLRMFPREVPLHFKDFLDSGLEAD